MLAKSIGEGGGKSPEELELAVRQIVSRAIPSDKVIDIFDAAGLKKPDISILSDEFLAEQWATEALEFDTSPRPHGHLVKSLIKKSMYIVFTMWFHNGDAKHIDISTPTLASSDRANSRQDFRRRFLCTSSRSRCRLYSRASFDVSCRHAFAASENH